MTESSRDRLFDFDPTGVWNLFTDVQRLGFETAASVVRRFSRLVDEDLRPGRRAAGFTDKEGTGSSSEERLSATVQSAMGAYADLMQASWDAFNAAMELTLDLARPWFGSRPADRVEIQCQQGQKATASFYVHNPSSAPSNRIEIATDGLIGPGGELIKPSSVEFEPAEIEAIPANGRAEVKVTVAIDKKAASGRYVGLIRASTQPPTELDVAVVVGSTQR
jgi:hypothetical protein